jgi:integrase
VPTGPVELTQEDCQRLAALWLASFLDSDLRWYRDGSTPRAQLEAMDRGNDEFESHLVVGLDSVAGRFNPSCVASLVATTLAHYRLSVDAASSTYARLCVEFMHAGLRAVAVCRRRYAGYMGDEVPSVESLPLPAAIPKNEPKAPAICLDELVEYWEKQEAPRHRTVSEVRHAFKVLQGLSVDVTFSAGTLLPEHVIRFKDAQLAAGKSPATVRKQLNLMGAVFSTAKKNLKVAANPFAGIHVSMDRRSKKKRVPFSGADLTAIFTTPIYTVGYRPVGGGVDAAFWLPLLALYSGARMEELAQLLITDVGEEGGIPYLHITDIPDEDESAPRKSLKNASSRRKTPIHPELSRIGFFQYVDHMKDQGVPRLFPKVTTSSGDKRQQSANFSKWFGRYLREVAKVEDRRKTFHSFRHGFKDAARRAEVPTEQHHAMTGHGSDNEGDKYGDDFYPLEPLSRSMAKIRFEGLDLSGLAWDSVSQKVSRRGRRAKD